MNRKLAALGGLACLVLLAGCAGLTGAAENGADEEIDRTIDVTAEGEAEADPDRASIRVAVTATDDDPEAVRDELATQEDTLRAALSDWGLDEDDIRTDRYSVRETHQSRQEPNVTEYEGEHRYQIAVDDVDAVGEVIDVAIDGGADDVQRIEFGLSEERESELREEALADAMDAADADAEIIAANAGLSVVGVAQVSTADARSTPYTTSDVAATVEADDASAADTGVEAGDVSVSVTLAVSFEAEESR